MNDLRVNRILVGDVRFSLEGSAHSGACGNKTSNRKNEDKDG
jgi:hypothetical protein